MSSNFATESQRSAAQRLQGIKVTDAESKRKIRAKLAQELEEKMDLDQGDDGWQEMTADEAARMQS